MGKSSGRGHQPYLPPVKNIDVEKPKNIRKRLVAIAIFAIIGVVGIGLGIHFSREWEDGWKIVESDNVLGCASQISFHYYLAGEGAKDRSKEVARLYTELCAKEDLAYSVRESAGGGGVGLDAKAQDSAVQGVAAKNSSDADSPAQGVAAKNSSAVDSAAQDVAAGTDNSLSASGEADGAASGGAVTPANLYDLNANPNVELLVSPTLYGTLSKLKAFGVRYHFLGPVYETYEGLFSCMEDRETADFDPYQNDYLAEEFRQIAAFAKDPKMVDVEILGDNRVKLIVSEAYAAFAKKHAVGRFVDLSALKNAAILDDMAAAFAEKGLTEGYFQTADGYGLNMTGATLKDASFLAQLVQSPTADSTAKAPTDFTLNVANAGDGIVAQLAVTPPLAFAAFRNYSLTEIDKWWHYTFADGTSRSFYIDETDGMPRTAIGDLLLLSEKEGCLAIAAKGVSVYAKETLDLQGLSEDVAALWCEGKTLCTAGYDGEVQSLAEGYGRLLFTPEPDTR